MDVLVHLYIPADLYTMYQQDFLSITLCVTMCGQMYVYLISICIAIHCSLVRYIGTYSIRIPYCVYQSETENETEQRYIRDRCIALHIQLYICPQPHMETEPNIGIQRYSAIQRDTAIQRYNAIQRYTCITTPQAASRCSRPLGGL